MSASAANTVKYWLQSRGRVLMETPLTPLDFARRARKLYPQREAVVDHGRRFSYAEFLARCDRWSAALLALGVKRGDRIAVISPNGHALLECFYAIPQIGAIIVPVNFRLAAADFLYLLRHSGAALVCAHPDYLDAVEGILKRLPRMRHCVAFSGARGDWRLPDAGCDSPEWGYGDSGLGRRDSRGNAGSDAADGYLLFNRGRRDGRRVAPSD